MSRLVWCVGVAQLAVLRYVGREQVDGVWTDHWSCHIDYIGVTYDVCLVHIHCFVWRCVRYGAASNAVVIGKPIDHFPELAFAWVRCRSKGSASASDWRQLSA